MSRVFELEMQRDILKEKNKKLKAKLTETNKKVEEQAKEIARLRAQLDAKEIKKKVATISTTTTTNPYTATWTVSPGTFTPTNPINIAGSDSIMYNVSSA